MLRNNQIQDNWKNERNNWNNDWNNWKLYNRTSAVLPRSVRWNQKYGIQSIHHSKIYQWKNLSSRYWAYIYLTDKLYWAGPSARIIYFDHQPSENASYEENQERIMILLEINFLCLVYLFVIELLDYVQKFGKWFIVLVPRYKQQGRSYIGFRKSNCFYSKCMSVFIMNYDWQFG